MKSVRWVAPFAAVVLLARADNRCEIRATAFGTVCVCNSTYCDTIPRVRELQPGQYQLYSTSKANLGFSVVSGNFSNGTQAANVTVLISDLNTISNQSVIGFGGAFTDSAGINIRQLSNNCQEALLQSYFGENGVQYSLGRVPVAGSDFSTRGYTYCDNGNGSLDSFGLEEEDHLYKIPFIRRALEIRGTEHLKLLASTWSAPKWMKTNKEFNGIGRVKDEYYGLWAEYHIKFFDAYRQNNISFWGMTTQNEPVNGVIGTIIPSNGFTGSQMVNWIKNALGPAIRNSSYSDLKIILHDDQRILLPLFNLFVLSDSEVLHYADGVGVHWYSDAFSPADNLNLASSNDKQLIRLLTEACTGYQSFVGLENAVELGSWGRAERYLASIMEYLKYDFGGWMDWNMALNELGGPNWINNEVDSPIIINGTADEFYKQPMFYALGHFSKFVVTGSLRIATETSGNEVVTLAFRRPDGKIAVILRNKSLEEKTVKLTILESTEVLKLQPLSINTLLYAL